MVARSGYNNMFGNIYGSTPQQGSVNSQNGQDPAWLVAAQRQEASQAQKEKDLQNMAKKDPNEIGHWINDGSGPVWVPDANASKQVAAAQAQLQARKIKEGKAGTGVAPNQPKTSIDGTYNIQGNYIPPKDNSSQGGPGLLAPTQNTSPSAGNTTDSSPPADSTPPKIPSNNGSTSNFGSGGVQSVEDTLNKILASDSRYVQQARQSGMEYGASRGLLNSSISAGAAERAAIEAGLPIAQQDAGYTQDLGRTRAQELASSRLSDQEYRQTGSLTELKGNIESKLAGQKGDIDKDLERFKQGQATKRAQMEIEYNEWAKSKDLTTEERRDYSNEVGRHLANFDSRVADINARGDINPEEKAKMIEKQQAALDATLEAYKNSWESRVVDVAGDEDSLSEGELGVRPFYQKLFGRDGVGSELKYWADRVADPEDPVTFNNLEKYMKNAAQGEDWGLLNP